MKAVTVRVHSIVAEIVFISVTTYVCYGGWLCVVHYTGGNQYKFKCSVFLCVVYIVYHALQHIAYRMCVIVAHKIIYSARRMHCSIRRAARVRTLLTILYVNIAMIIV